jgi:hypothetical protein
LSIDPGNAGADVGNPQSWNAYSYVISNPLLYVDPDGRTYRICEADGNNCNEVSDQDWEDYIRNDGNGLIVANNKIYQRLESGRQGNLIGTVRWVGGDYGSTALQSALQEGIDVASPVADARFVAGFYGASIVGGIALNAAGVYSGGQLVTLNIGQAGAAAEATSTSSSLVGAGLRRQIQLHRQKLANYRRNPDAFDNKGFLKNASPQRRDQIIKTRIRSLEHQIRNFEKQLERLLNGK